METIEFFHEDIIEAHLETGASLKNNRINNIICPACGHNEGFAYIDKPEWIRCNRGNNCGENTHAKAAYPELFTALSEKFPTTETDNKATARAFIALRGLNPDSFDFEQGSFTIDGKTYPTVLFTQDGVRQHRIIDYTGKDKNRTVDSYSGKVYATKSVDSSDVIFVVEGIFNALSFEQSGHAAIATYSSGSIPKEWLLANKAKSFVIAFDNDPAGKKGARNLVKFFQDNDLKYQVAFTPKGKDWNDLLLSGSLDGEAIYKAYWQGKLEFAKSAHEWFEIYRERHTECNLKVFSFNMRTFIGSTKKAKKDDDAPELAIKQIADCAFKLLHSTVDDSDSNRQKMTHVIEIESDREGKARFDLDANEITRIDSFKSAVANHRQIFSGSGDDLNYLASHLFNQKPQPPKLRALSVVGYDDKSKWFVYPKFAYDTQGKRIAVCKDGYFEKAGVRPFNNFSDTLISNIEPIDIPEVIKLIYAAYGNKGLLAFGFYVATTYSHTVFKHFNFFPFLSLEGAAHSGKSGLSTLLNRSTFIDSEGHTMSKTNTAKGELRKIGQGASIVRALLEGRKDASRFDYDSILPLYNRNSLYTRATTSQDNRTHDLPLKAAISFVWNHPCFTLKAAKERVISLPFLDKDSNDTTLLAWEQLQQFSPEQLAGIGHFLLSNRTYFESQIVKTCVSHSKTLREQGIKVTRIADNHAIALAGITCFIDLLGISDDYREGLLNYTTKIAAKKLETAKTDNPIADLFLETLKDKMFITQIENGKFCFHLPTALEKLAKEGHSFPDKVKLVEGLKGHDDYVAHDKKIHLHGDASKLYAQRCWVFRNNYSSDGFIE